MVSENAAVGDPKASSDDVGATTDASEADTAGLINDPDGCI
jgi:hypothetical protein